MWWIYRELISSCIGYTRPVQRGSRSTTYSARFIVSSACFAFMISPTFHVDRRDLAFQQAYKHSHHTLLQFSSVWLGWNIHHHIHCDPASTRGDRSRISEILGWRSRVHPAVVQSLFSTSLIHQRPSFVLFVFLRTGIDNFRLWTQTHHVPHVHYKFPLTLAFAFEFTVMSPMGFNHALSFITIFS